MVSRVTFIGTREQADDVIPMSQEDVTMYKYILDKHNKILILKKNISYNSTEKGNAMWAKSRVSDLKRGRSA